MKNRFLLGLFWLLSSHFVLAAEETVISKIFPVGGVQQEPLFVQTTKIGRSSPESFTSSAKIENPQGKILMTEKVVVKDGQLVFQAVEQFQTNEAWELEVQGKKAKYRVFKITEEGKKVSVAEKISSIGERFINGPMVEQFIAGSWQELLQGRKVEAEFSVLELQRPVRFRFSKEKEDQREGKSVLVLKMVPANLILSMLVQPIFMEFDKLERRLLYFKGRTPLKIDSKGSLVPLERKYIITSNFDLS